MESLGLVSSPKVVLGVSPNARNSLISSKQFVGLPYLLRKTRKNPSLSVVSLFEATKTIAENIKEKTTYKIWKITRSTTVPSALMYRRIATPFPKISRALVGEKGPAAALRDRASSYCIEAQQQRHFSSYPGLLRQSQGMSSENGKAITRVLFCGPHFPASHNYTIEYLQSHPFIEVDVVPFEEIPDVIGNYDICVVKSMRLNSAIIARASKMKLIMQFGVGLEGVDINAATKHGIKVARIPSNNTGNATSCAEMAVYLMLGLLRKQYEMQIAIREKKLGDPIGDTLLGKTIFILGCGNIGIHLAKRLRPFGVNILATKRSWPSLSQDSCNDGNGTLDELVDEKGSHQDILKFASRADIVVCCLTMNSETAGIVDNTFISSMRKGALLVNISRGKLLDYNAVLHHLKSGHLGGLGTDVAWTEPFDPDDAILKFPNVIMTPHVAGVTEYSYRSMAKVVGDVALQLHSGLSLTGVETVN